MTAPNDRQRDLIERTDGCVLVDAGPGTGKTFAVSRRYATIVDQDDVTPDDVLLLTFTRNAAREMRDRAVDRCEYGVRELRDAPIGTFHSRCSDILRTHGVDAPTHLGLDQAITHSTRVIEDESLELEHFREFLAAFTDAHPEHHDCLRVCSNPGTLLGLVRTLGARGIVPTETGWFRDGESHLRGDPETFAESFERLNRPRNDGSKQSRLRDALSSYGRDRCYLPDAPEKGSLRGDGKAVPGWVREAAFEADREALVSFLHDCYYEYLAFSLSRNYLNFSFLQVLAFVLLCERDALRERLAADYVMIDEFQDTSEIQFKLALLLSGTENLCAVGDWKQSIYSFQHAAVENITAFEDRLERFRAELNADRHRVAAFGPVHRIELERNYRSTQPIIDRSEEALCIPGSSRESLDAEAIGEQVVSLTAETDRAHTRLERFRHEDEPAAICSRVCAMVGSEDYAVREDGELRPATFGDVAVLTRRRAFGRELLEAAEDRGVPMAYEGGVEVYRTDAAKRLLAWLRVLEGSVDEARGWAAILEDAGYTLAAIDDCLETNEYPADMLAFRSDLEDLETPGAVARRVFERYGHDGPTADVLRSAVRSVVAETTATRGDLVRFLERGIDEGTTQEVSTAAGTDAVTVQTIHAAKGLEYPIVVVADVNSRHFPASGSGGGPIRYDDVLGIRQRTVYAEAHGEPHHYDNWRWDVLDACLPTEYDEERRLLYVAMTRARDHLLVSAGENPSPFFEGLSVPETPCDTAVEAPGGTGSVQTSFSVAFPEPSGPRGYSPHTLMSDAAFEDVEEGRGRAYGSRVHDFAERYVLEGGLEPRDADERRVSRFLESLEGTCHVEQDAALPLEVEGERVTVRGVVDLVHVTDDSVEIVDYKTDLGRHAESEYRTQLSVYWHVLSAVYPDRTVEASIFYTALGERVTVEPRSREEITALVAEQRG